jgi:hypothetical protein
MHGFVGYGADARTAWKDAVRRLIPNLPRCKFTVDAQNEIEFCFDCNNERGLCECEPPLSVDALKFTLATLRDEIAKPHLDQDGNERARMIDVVIKEIARRGVKG